MVECGEMASEYITTLADKAQLPGLIKDGFLKGFAEPRVAFVGRSNVGKSSLINALLREKIARVSATPGKTRAIHFFRWLDTKRIVVDLPGYGFAKVAKSEQKEWSSLLDAYFHAESHLEIVFMLFDSRHGPTDQDLEALEYFVGKRIPIQIILTKIDQLKNQSMRATRKREILEILAPYSITNENLIWVSVNQAHTIDKFRGMFK
jgi:GTP-binding protein